MAYKILFIVHKMTYGGAQKIMAFLANGLSSDGYNIYLLTYEDMTLGQALAPGVKHLGLSFSPPSIYALRRVLQIIGVRKVINRVRPDVIIAFLPYANIISIIAAVGTRVPVIISERGDPNVLQSWFTQLRDFIYNFSDGYVFQTEEAKKHFNKRIQAKAAVIPNPVIVNNIPPKWVGNKDNVIVNVGRFELIQKRQDVLIKAFSKIADKFPDVNLVFYGEGKDKQEIIKIIADCNLEKRVFLAGYTENIYLSIMRSRLFVLSSDYEGIPNALIEAMVVGLPCISTDCSPGGAASLIKNLKNGILVKTGCVEELAQAMEFLLSHPEVAESMGESALKIKIDLNPTIIICQWKKYIDYQIFAKSSK
jgi:glycosyltransferase involved in cell wall biosynthesis